MRWGRLWAGVLTTIASFLVMQLAIFAAGLFRDGGDTGTWLTAAAALVAFFLAFLGNLVEPISTVASDLTKVQDLNLQNVPSEQVPQALEGALQRRRLVAVGLLLALVSSPAGAEEAPLGPSSWCPGSLSLLSSSRPPSRLSVTRHSAVVGAAPQTQGEAI